ncbi:MAG TPA: thioredoxin family protein [Casimicrobiaceae bacterium]|nr:thioredoxin family protein [Casimicrobiaceae bacterium]
MHVLTTTSDDREALAAAFDDPARIIVVALCAAWCDTCREFRAGFDRLAQSRRQFTFVWLDVEDDADGAGDVDVENFPTLAIYRGDEPIHFGVSLPHETTIGRLVDALATHAPVVAADEAVSGLPAKLAAAARGRR